MLVGDLVTEAWEWETVSQLLEQPERYAHQPGVGFLGEVDGGHRDRGEQRAGL